MLHWPEGNQRQYNDLSVKRKISTPATDRLHAATNCRNSRMSLLRQSPGNQQKLISGLSKCMRVYSVAKEIVSINLQAPWSSGNLLVETASDTLAGYQAETDSRPDEANQTLLHSWHYSELLEEETTFPRGHWTVAYLLQTKKGDFKFSLQYDFTWKESYVFFNPALRNVCSVVHSC